VDNFGCKREYAIAGSMADIILMRTVNGGTYRVKIQATQMATRNVNKCILSANIELMLIISSEIDRWQFGISIGYCKI